VPLPPVLQSPLSVPVVASPMFIASSPELVIAQCTSGIIGSFPALNARPAEKLDEWLTRIEEGIAAFQEENPDAVVAPFAVNQIVHHSNDRLRQDMATIVKHKVPIVITSLGVVPEINEAVHSYGGIVLHDVIKNRHAQKAVEGGADGIIAVAAGAGGHAGSQSPFALLNEIRQWFDGPLLLSGAISHGRSIFAALAAGADFAYIGSPFLATPEANTVDDYKQMIVDSNASDVIYSNLFTGVHGNYLRGSIEKAGLDADNLPESDPSKMNFGSGGGNDAKAWKDIWGCGQGIGSITGIQPAADLIAQFRDEFRAAVDAFDEKVRVRQL
jgi:nitronate monooxygenase